MCHRLRSASALGGLLHDQNQRQAGGEHNGQKKEDVDVAHHRGRCWTMPKSPAAAWLGAVAASMPRTDKPRSWTFDAADRRARIPADQCYLC
jgi:hypothetical protein